MCPSVFGLGGAGDGDGTAKWQFVSIRNRQFALPSPTVDPIQFEFPRFQEDFKKIPVLWTETPSLDGSIHGGSFTDCINLLPQSHLEFGLLHRGHDNACGLSPEEEEEEFY